MVCVYVKLPFQHLLHPVHINKQVPGLQRKEKTQWITFLSTKPQAIQVHHTSTSPQYSQACAGTSKLMALVRTDRKNSEVNRLIFDSKGEADQHHVTTFSHRATTSSGYVGSWLFPGIQTPSREHPCLWHIVPSPPLLGNSWQGGWFENLCKLVTGSRKRLKS